MPTQLHRTEGTSSDVRNVAVDDLRETNDAVIRHEVEALGLDASRLHSSPFQVVPDELRVRRLLGLFGNRLDGRGAIDGLLGAGDIGQSVGVKQRRDVISTVKLPGRHEVDGWALTVALPN